MICAPDRRHRRALGRSLRCWPLADSPSIVSGAILERGCRHALALAGVTTDRRAPGSGTRDRLLTVAAVLLGIAWAAQLELSVPRSVLIAALVPAALWVGPLVLIGVRAGLRPAAVITTFLWGAAAAAPIAGEVNALVRGQLASLCGDGIGDVLAHLVIGPLVEEALKAVVLFPLLLGERARGGAVLASIVYGALSGMGFSATENARYLLVAAVQGGLAAMLVAAWSRAVVAGAKHAVYSATAGAGIGWAMARRTRPGLGLAAGLVAALLQHAAWNALVAHRLHDVVCNAATPGGPCRPGEDVVGLLVVAPALVATVLLPAALVLSSLAGRARREANGRDRLQANRAPSREGARGPASQE
jgi:RsiW-degrading membrane proteinase PrsW (M82 family)